MLDKKKRTKSAQYKNSDFGKKLKENAVQFVRKKKMRINREWRERITLDAASSYILLIPASPPSKKVKDLLKPKKCIVETIVGSSGQITAKYRDQRKISSISGGT